MKPNDMPESKILITKTNTNKKKIPEATDNSKKFDTSLLKKNEFALILLGALLLTLIVSFLFFRSSDPESESVKAGLANSSATDLETRIETLEKGLQTWEKSLGSADDKTAGDVQDIGLLMDRVTRLETAFSVKFDSLIERMGKIEKNISQMKEAPVATVTPKPTVTAVVKTAATPTAKPAAPVKKAVKKEKETSLFHTVKKGETLYSISKKYNTSVDTLRKMNKLSGTDKIYPGNNILVR